VAAPHHIDAWHGWSLDVEADGRSATVRPPARAIAITSIGTGTARIAGRAGAGVRRQIGDVLAHRSALQDALT
jgi:hypothetical protein